VWAPGAVRPHAMIDDDKILIFYEQYLPPLFHNSEIKWVEASIQDIDEPLKWSWPTTILKPELDWEKVGQVRVGSPYVFYDNHTSMWKMYYSASSVHLDDSDVDEPLHHGLAQS